MGKIETTNTEEIKNQKYTKFLKWINRPIVIITALLIIVLGYNLFTYAKAVYNKNLNQKLTLLKDQVIIAVVQQSLGCKTVKLTVPFKETETSEVKLKEINLRDITCESLGETEEKLVEPIVNPFVEETPAPTSEVAPAL